MSLIASQRDSFFNRYLAIGPAWLVFLAGCFCLHVNAQHPFYLQLLEDGKLAMAGQNWEQAQQDLEIASFGFLDKETLLAESYIRLALVYQALENREEVEAYVRDANLVLGEPPQKPPGLEAPYWESFLILSGRKAAPRPPVPTSENELERYLQAYPDSAEAWAALIDSQFGNARKSRIRQTIANALAAVPEDAGILERALQFDLLQDGERNAEELAAKLLILKPGDSIANEYLGGLAVKRKEWEKAQAHFALVTTPQLQKTAEHQRELAKALIKSQEEARTENQPPQQLQNPQEQGNESSAGEPVELADDNDQVPISLSEPPEVVSTEDGQTKEAEDPDATLQDRVDNLERLVRTNPSNADFRFELADAYLRNGEIRKAKKSLAKLARSHKNHPRYAEIYAHYQYVQGNYQANIDNLSGFVNPQGAIAYYLGMSYYQLGDAEKARTYLQGLDSEKFTLPQGFAVQPAGGGSGVQMEMPTSLSQEEALQWLADQAGQDNWQDIYQAMDGILARYPADPDVRYYQGRLFMSKGDYQDAMSIFIDLVGQGYGKNEIYYYAGVSALKRGNPSVAQYLFERAQANDTRFKAEIQSLLSERKRNK